MVLMMRKIIFMSMQAEALIRDVILCAVHVDRIAFAHTLDSVQRCWNNQYYI